MATCGWGLFILDNRALYDKSLESNNMSYSVFITCLNSDQQRCVVNKADIVTFWRVWSSDLQPACTLESHGKVKVIQLCPTLCNPMDYTVHGILQARILGVGSLSFSRGSSPPRDRTQVSSIAGGFFTSRATREAQEY